MHRRRSTSASPEPKDNAAAGEPGDAAAASAGGTPHPSPRGERSEAEEGDEALALTPEETLRDAEDGDVVSPLVSPRGERRSRSRAGSRPASAGAAAGASKIGRKRSRTDEILVKVAAEVEAEAAAAGLLEASPQRFAEALAVHTSDADEAGGASISGSGLPVQRALDAELLQAAREASSQGALSSRGDGSSIASTPRDGRPARAGQPGAPSGMGADGQDGLQPGSTQGALLKGGLAQQRGQKGKGTISAVVGEGASQGGEGYAEGLEDGEEGEQLLPGRLGVLSADERLARRQQGAKGARDGVVLEELEGDADTLAQRRASYLGASVSVPDGVEGRMARQQQRLQEQGQIKKAADAARVDVHASAADKAALGQLAAAAEELSEGAKLSLPSQLSSPLLSSVPTAIDTGFITWTERIKPGVVYISWIADLTMTSVHGRDKGY